MKKLVLRTTICTLIFGFTAALSLLPASAGQNYPLQTPSIPGAMVTLNNGVVLIAEDRNDRTQNWGLEYFDTHSGKSLGTIPYPADFRFGWDNQEAVMIKLDANRVLLFSNVLTYIYDLSTKTFRPIALPNSFFVVNGVTVFPLSGQKILYFGYSNAAVFDGDTESFEPLFAIPSNLQFGPKSILPLDESSALLIAKQSNCQGDGCATANLKGQIYKIDLNQGTFSLLKEDTSLQRANATCLKLKSGRILIFGGEEVTDALIYNPNTNELQSIPIPYGDFVGSAFTLLDDGRVLILQGGWGDEDSINTYLFDENTNQLTSSTSLTLPRSMPVVAKISADKYLVAGASVYNSAAAQVPEEINLTSNADEIFGISVMHRMDASSISLDDGRVLTMGGYDEEWSNYNQKYTDAYLPQAEVFDPARLSSTLIEPKMNSTTAKNTPSLLAQDAPIFFKLTDGSVLSVGFDESVSGKPWNASILKYTPTHDSTEVLGSVALVPPSELSVMQDSQAHLPAVFSSQGDKILILTGCQVVNGKNVSQFFEFNTIARQSSPVSANGLNFCDASITLLPDGRALLFGNFGIFGSTGAWAIFDFDQNEFTAQGTFDATKTRIYSIFTGSFGVHLLMNNDGNATQLLHWMSFDPNTGALNALTDVTFSSQPYQFTSLSQERALVLESDAQSYDILSTRTGQILSQGKFSQTREAPSIAELPDGRIFVNSGLSLKAVDNYFNSTSRTYEWILPVLSSH